MLRIRLQRTGRKNLPTYRIVVAEKSQAVKKKYVDLVGHYLPTQNPKVLEVDQEKVKDWISKGAIPTDTVASLCKSLGMKDMEKYMEPRNKKRNPKNPEEVEEPAPAAPAADETEAPTEEAAPAEPAVEETPTEEPSEPEAPAEEKSKEEEAPAPEEKPAEEAEAPKEEEAPAEETESEEEKKEE